jgi:2-hydroxy-3-keto-5-methylthiopentenyl-1-phosphate phosphatase
MSVFSRLARQLRSITTVRPTLKRKSPYRLFVEQLEDRCVPATVNWLNPVSGNWNDGTKWSTGTAPAAGDTVVIDKVGANYTVTLNVNVDAANALAGFTLNSPTAVFSSSAHVFNVNGPGVINQGSVIWLNSNWSGTGTLTNRGAMTMSNNSSTIAINVPLTNEGSFVVRGFNNQFNGTVVNEATGMLTLLVDNTFFGTNLTLAAGMTNRGRVELKGATTAISGTEPIALITGGGTLVNEAGGIVEALRTGDQPTTFDLTAQLDNRGAINFTAPTGNTQRINKAGANHLNSGTINVTSSAALTVSQFNSLDNSGPIQSTGSGGVTISGNNQSTSTMTNSGTLTASAGGLGINTLATLTNTTTGLIDGMAGNLSLTGYTTASNSGAIAVGAGRSFNVSGGTLNNAAGATIGSDGTITLNTATLSVADAFTPGNATLNLNNSNIVGAGSFTNQAVTTMLNNTTTKFINVALTNLGTFTVRGFNLQFNNTVVNETGATLTLLTDNSIFGTSLALGVGMTNRGRIELKNATSVSSSDVRVALSTSAGTLVNESGGVIEALKTGTNNPAVHIYHLASQLDNRGVINFTVPAAADQRINKVGANQVNSGSINVTGSAGMFITSFNSFNNTGTIQSTAGGGVTISGNNQSTSTLTNSGTLTASAGGLGINTLATLTNTTTGLIDGMAGNLALTGYTTAANNGVIAVGAGRTLTVSGGTINNGVGATIGSDGTITLTAATLNVADAFSPGNATLNLNNSVVVGSGSFTNQAVTTMLNNTTTKFINVPLTNLGSFTARGANLQFNNSVVNEAGATLTLLTDNSIFTTALALGVGMTNRGRIELKNATSVSASDVRVALATTSGTLVNEPSGVIEALKTGTNNPAIHIYHLTTQLDNRGVINFTVPAAADQRINKAGANHLSSGAINVTGTAGLIITPFASFTNSGQINATTAAISITSGTTLTNTGTMAVAGGLSLGSIANVFGVGAIGGNVSVTSSAVRPGLSPGVLNVSGNYTQNSASSFNVELGGLTPGTGHDQLNVAGVATLAGTLNVSLVGGFMPSPGDTFTVMTFASQSGTFSTVNGLSLGGGMFLRAVYNPNDLTLVAYSSASAVNIHPTTLAVAEGGGTAKYAVTLSGTTAPTANVVVNINPGAQVGVSPASVTFTPANWQMPQLVTVTAIDDAVVEGSHVATITHTSTSTQAAYNNLALASVNVNITDNDQAIPAPSTPDLDTASDTGSSASDDITKDATPAFTGTAVPGSTVEVFDGAVSLGTAIADGAGAWSLTSPPLTDGDHTVTATATVSGFVSPPSAALTITIDTTAPTITAAADIAPNVNGWNNTDVVVSYTFSDNAGGSGIDASVSDVADDSLSASGVVSGMVFDLAGNSATANYSALIDKVAPTISATPDIGPNANGWNNTDVTVSYQVSDNAGGSGIDPVLGDFSDDLLTESGTATGVVYDLAGNIALASYSALIDKVAPTISATPDIGPNSNGWNNTDVAVSYQVSDNAGGSGIDPVLGDFSDDLLTNSDTAAGIVYDLAGNVAVASYSALIDKVAPTISATLDKDPFDSGWYNIATGAPTATFSGADNGAGLASVSAPFLFGEGSHLSAIGTASDLAGNSTTASFFDVFVDLTAPAAPVITSPVDGTVIEDATVTLAGTAEPGAIIGVFMDQSSLGTTQADSNGDWGFNTPILTAETHEFSATATDVAGNCSEPSANVGVNFQPSAAANISGAVFLDVNGNGLYDANELGIDGVLIQLQDALGNAVLNDLGQPVTATTTGGGFYLFEDLLPGVYRLHELQPTGVTDDAEILGSVGGTIPANDTMQLVLHGAEASDYNFAERGQQVSSGDTATIGFWQNKNGQALINAAGANLAQWLAQSFPNVFGNAFATTSVAAFYKEQLFKQAGKKQNGPARVDCQFMAVALATYFTSSNLAGNIASAYGFNVTDTGIATRIVNVGASGAAFGVANGTTLTIKQLLDATNDMTDASVTIAGFDCIYDLNGDGIMDSYEASLRSQASVVYSAINEEGDIV